MGKDITGLKFGRLTVIKPIGKNKISQIIYECKCDCGNIINIQSNHLIPYHTRSCGCLKKENEHKMTTSRFYKIWNCMKNRCLNSNHDNYKNYGSRGITVCQEWLDFKNFKSDMYKSYLEHVDLYGEKQTTIDRINNNKGYFKENCRWATLKEQHNNTRSCIYRKKIKAISPKGKEYIFVNYSEFAKQNNLSSGCIYNCLKKQYKQHKGWQFEYI